MWPGCQIIGSLLAIWSPLRRCIISVFSAADEMMVFAWFTWCWMSILRIWLLCYILLQCALKSEKGQFWEVTLFSSKFLLTILKYFWSEMMISKISDIFLWDKSCMLCTIFPIMDVHCVLWDRLVFFFFFVCFDSMDNQSQYQYTITKKACQKNSSCFWLVERETVFSAERSLMQTAMRESFLVRHTS